MEQIAQIQSHERLVQLSRILLIVVVCIAMLVLSGWMFDIPILRKFFPGFASMNPLAAVCFILITVAFYIVPADGKPAFKTVFFNMLALLVITVTTAKLSGFSFNSTSSVDTWLFRDKVDREFFDDMPNRMASSTATCFIIASIAVLLRNFKTKLGYTLFQGVSLILFLTGILSLLGYMYGSSVFYGVFYYIPMALHTAICFVILGISFLLRYPHSGFMREISNPSTGGLSARFLIPFAILVPALLGLIRTQVVRAGFISSEFGVAAYVLAIIFCLLFVIWYVALIINRKDKLRIRAERDLEKSKMELEALNKKLEEDVREKTIEIRDIFQRVSDVFYAVNMEDRFTFVNNRAAKVFGFKREEMIGKLIWDFFPRETLSEQFKSCYEAAQTLQQLQTMEGFSQLAGSWFMVNMYPSPGGVSIILQDITERKKAEDQLVKEKKFSDSVIKSLPGIFYYYDEKGKLLNWNKNFEIVSGYTGEEISRMRPDRFFADDEKKYIRSRISRVFTEGYADAEADFLSKDGTRTPYYFSGILSEYEGKPCVTGVGFEITERKKAEQALKLSESKYRILFEWNPIPMWMLSLPEFNFIDVNNAAIQHYGYSLEEFLSMNARDIRTPEEAERLKIEINKKYPEVTHVGLWKHQKKNKESIIVETIIHDIEIGGKPVRLVLANDVTDKIKAREALEASNETLRQLTSHLQEVREEERKHIAREIHDELGQQLTVIKMDVSWIKKKSDPANTMLIKKIDELLELLDDTVKTVRELSSRLRPSLLDDLGLVAAIEWHLNDFRQRTGLAIEADLPEYEIELPEPVTTALFRILQESLTNVARHSGAKKAVVKLEKENDNVILSIQDDGKGYTESFDSGKKTLGILGMKERAAMIGGVYTIQGFPGKGTLVSVSVPVVQYLQTQKEGI